MFRLETILISTNESECFFHVLGDTKEYYDIDSLKTAHPELEMLILLNGLELERELRRCKELLGTVSY